VRALALILLVPVAAAAENWPSFRGPNASGIADGLGVPTRWDGVRSIHVEWKTKLPGLGHYVVAAGPRYEILSTNPMGEVLMATPAAAPERLFIRGQHHLFSIREKEGGGSPRREGEP
jgi:hypothetical protein